MNWENRNHYNSPILNKKGPFKLPDTFYTAFSIVFGKIRREKRAIRFLESLNKEMNNRKGGGKLRKEEIVELRKDDYVNATKLCIYNNHHVIPTSRDNRTKGEETINEKVLIPKKFHAAWHVIFVNLYDEEAVIFLERIFFTLKKSNCIDYCVLTNIIESLTGEQTIHRG